MYNVLQSSRKRSNRDILTLFDVKKAFDSIKRSLLWKILRQRAKTKEEKHIAELIIQLHSTHKIFFSANEYFTANKGIPQGGVLAPFLFNIYLEQCLLNPEELKEAID